MRLLILSTFLLVSLTATAESLRFARNENLPEQDVAEAVFRQVMRNLKVNVVIDAVPPARANMLNLSAAVAGEVARIESYGAKNPSLIRVEPGHYYLTSVAFARKDSGIKLAGVADLAQYKVAHIRGVQHSTDIVKDLPFMRESNNSESLFSLLEAGRVDVVVTTGVDGRMMLQQMQLTDQIEPVAELARRELFVYLNPGFKQWQQPISLELQRMKASGDLAKIIAEQEQLLVEAAALIKAPAANGSAGPAVAAGAVRILLAALSARPSDGQSALRQAAITRNANSRL
jgi:hypothetical protein